MDPGDVLSESARDGVRILTLSRPPVNALDNATLRALCEALERLDGEPGSGGVVLTARGRCFSAGGDFKELRDADADRGVERVRLGHRLCVAAESLRRPFVCAVNGDAVGGGFELCMFADYAVAVPGARLGMPEINNGVLPMAKGIQQIVRALGLRAARGLLYSGRLVAADDARRRGMIDEVAEPGRLLDRACAWAEAMVAKDPALFAALKRTIAQAGRCTDEELEAMTVADFRSYFGSPRSRSSLDAFLKDG